MKYEITALVVTLLATTLIAGTILAASATYPYGANPVLMKNAQAQENEVVMAPLVNLSFPNQEMIGPTPEAGIKQGGGEGVEEATEVFGPNDTLPQNSMIVPTFEGPKQAPLPLPSDKPELTPIEKPEPIPDQAPVQTAAPVEECSPEEIAIIEETNKTGTEVITVIEENVMNTATVEEITEVVENITEQVEASVNDTAAPEEVTEVAETVVEVVEETPEVQTQVTGSGLLALLEKLVESQDYNENLTDNERATLDAELGVAKTELSAAFTENVI